MAGLPGTGKTTLACALAARLPAVILNKDIVRARLFSPSEIDFSRKQDDLCMRVIFANAGQLLRASTPQNVIVDGRTFSKTSQVEDLLAWARSIPVTPAFIECVCDDAVVRERLGCDRNHPAGNRTFPLYLALKKEAEPVTMAHLVIDTSSAPVETSLGKCLAYLETFQ